MSGVGQWKPQAWPFESRDPLVLPEAYASARLSSDAAPVLVRGSVPAYLVTRHKLVSDLLRNPALSADPARDCYPAPSSRSLDTKRHQQAFVRLDPPEHGRYRRAVLPALAKTTVARMGEFCTRIAHRCVEDMLRNGVSDVVATLAAPLPLHVSAYWLGVPLHDAAELMRSAEMWAGLTEGSAAPEQLQGVVDDYFVRRLSTTSGQGWSESTSSVISALEAAGVVERDGVARTLGLLFTSGLFTTRNTLALMMLALARDAGELDRLLYDENLDVGRAAEEVLRLTCVPRFSALRTTTADLAIGSVLVPAGSGVIASVAAANRDPDVFEEPNGLRLDRTPNRHLTFGPGTHGCVGSALARLEIIATLKALRAQSLSVHQLRAEQVEFHGGTTMTVDRLVIVLR